MQEVVFERVFMFFLDCNNLHHYIIALKLELWYGVLKIREILDLNRLLLICLVSSEAADKTLILYLPFDVGEEIQ